MKQKTVLGWNYLTLLILCIGRCIYLRHTKQSLDYFLIVVVAVSILAFVSAFLLTGKGHDAYVKKSKHENG